MMGSLHCSRLVSSSVPHHLDEYRGDCNLDCLRENITNPAKRGHQQRQHPLRGRIRDGEVHPNERIPGREPEKREYDPDFGKLFTCDVQPASTAFPAQGRPCRGCSSHPTWDALERLVAGTVGTSLYGQRNDNNSSGYVAPEHSRLVRSRRNFGVAYSRQLYSRHRYPHSWHLDCYCEFLCLTLNKEAHKPYNSIKRLVDEHQLRRSRYSVAPTISR
ncbi:hypothetical protein SAMN04488691_11227 [Haloferax larsenii]|uniref:Uncharacterized protein n=1 Tax=Haloferax larsenii TaxID=302484 RepID=A0A1H7UBT3_HALLR|nr:hypothetical protein SAMN04488691_11227 [Haloferax larsenii]